MTPAKESERSEILCLQGGVTLRVRLRVDHASRRPRRTQERSSTEGYVAIDMSELRS